MMSGSSTGTGWAYWFCHLCRWSGCLTAGQMHVCQHRTPAPAERQEPA